jgi:hypothetical protein
MSDDYHSGFLTRTLPTVFLFILGVLAFVFMLVTSKMNRFDSRMRSANDADEPESDE